MISSKTELPAVSAVILNWNRPRDTLKCIESVKQQTFPDIEIVVVDNGSADNSLELLDQVSGITLVKNTLNKGFTGGHIDGLRHTKGDYIFVLNNDAIVDEDYITNAISILERDDRIAAVGGRSYHWAKDIDTPTANTTSTFYAFQKINPNTMEGIFEHTDAGFDHVVNWVSGSAMVIRRKAIEEVGYFFDPMFAYYEESDLFARLQSHDYKIIYSPSLKIWHKDGASSSSYFQYYQLFRNRFIYAARNLPRRAFYRFVKTYLKTTLRGAYHSLIFRTGNEEEAIVNRALKDAFVFTTKTWPKWLSTKRHIKLVDSAGLSLVDRLKIEQTGISFVGQLTDRRHISDELVNFIKNTSYEHYYSEFVFVCDQIHLADITQQIKERGLSPYNIKLVANKHLSKSNPLNLGWLSASHDKIWFIESSNYPSNKTVGRACVVTGDTNYSLYCYTTDGQPSQRPQDYCISRSLLALYGGIDTDNLTSSLFNLYYFASSTQQITVTAEPGSLYRAETIEPKTDEAVLRKTKLIRHQLQSRSKKSSRYARLLERYYRLYQLHNLSIWVFVTGISPRHKLARLRNVLLAAASLNKRNLALEIKHITNEAIKLTHSGYDKETREDELRSKASAATVDNNWRKTPIFIICRDRLSPLKQLVGWLERAGITHIVLIDNASAYPPLLDYYKTCPYQVILTGKNIGHTVVWTEGVAKTLFPGTYYIVTDPDVVPDSQAPLNSIKYFYSLHKKYIDYQKVGFGLQIDDLPDHYKLKNEVIRWEKQFWVNEVESKVYEAGIDTTFALYKPYTDFYILHPSLRTGRPYTAKHLPWYVDSSKIDEEEAFYRMHANQDITSWNTDEILERYTKELNRV